MELFLICYNNVGSTMLVLYDYGVTNMLISILFSFSFISMLPINTTISIVTLSIMKL